MTDLLIAFVIPILVIIAAAILQKILRNPFEVAGIIFIILIIVALILGGTTLFITLAWIYTILAFITSLIVSRFCRCHRNHQRCRENGNNGDFITGNLGISMNNGNNNTGRNNRGNNNIGDNNIGNNNIGNNNIGNNNTGNYNVGNNNVGNNNNGNNHHGHHCRENNNDDDSNDNDNINCNRCNRHWRE